MSDATTVFQREQEELAASNLPATAHLLGSTVPEVMLLDVNGAQVKLTAAVDRPAVIVLYRGAWRP